MTAQITPPSTDEIEILLDEYLETDINRLNTVTISEALAAYPRYKQDSVLHWVKIGSKAHSGLGYSIALNTWGNMALKTPAWS